MDRLIAQREELNEAPPVDDLVAAYFRAQGWLGAAPVTNGDEDDGAEPWEFDLPDDVD